MKFAIQIIVSVIAISWVIYSLHNLDWSISWEAFSHLSRSKLAACFVFVILIYISRLFRLGCWVNKLSRIKLSYGEWIGIYLKSIAFGSITPARLGDFSRISLLAKTELDLVTRGKVILLDKLADTLYIPLGICITAWIVGEKLQVSAPGLFAGGLIIFFIYIIGMYWFGRSLGIKTLFVGWLLTVMGFCFFVSSNALLFHAVGIKLSVLDITAIIISVGVLVSLPISIGGIGIREGSLVSLLQLWGVSLDLTPPVLMFEFILNIIFPIILYLLWQLFLYTKNHRIFCKNES